MRRDNDKPIRKSESINHLNFCSKCNETLMTYQEREISVCNNCFEYTVNEIFNQF